MEYVVMSPYGIYQNGSVTCIWFSILFVSILWHPYICYILSIVQFIIEIDVTFEKPHKKKYNKKNLYPRRIYEKIQK